MPTPLSVDKKIALYKDSKGAQNSWRPVMVTFGGYLEDATQTWTEKQALIKVRTVAIATG